MSDYEIISKVCDLCEIFNSQINRHPLNTDAMLEILDTIDSELSNIDTDNDYDTDINEVVEDISSWVSKNRKAIYGIIEREWMYKKLGII